MKIKTDKYRVREGDEVDLKKWPTKVGPIYKEKEHYQDLLADHVARLSEQQQLFYASDRHAVLLIFQAMDAAGKDGAIRHVMSGVNPQGCQVFSFKQPSATELQHDFPVAHDPGPARAGPHRGYGHVFGPVLVPSPPTAVVPTPVSNLKGLRPVMAPRQAWRP